MFCERIKLTNLITRESPSGSDASSYQQYLIQIIRQEFNHNLAQQIYVSPQTWNQLNALVETTIQYIFVKKNQFNGSMTDVDFAKTLIEGIAMGEGPKIQLVIDLLKNEIRSA